MKSISIILSLAIITACANNSGSKSTTDTTSINTKTSSPADGGPNNGMRDTNTYNRANDTIVNDSMQKKK